MGGLHAAEARHHPESQRDDLDGQNVETSTVAEFAEILRSQDLQNSQSYAKLCERFQMSFGQSNRRDVVRCSRGTDGSGAGG